ncbi:MAG TPA: class I SAM-dependent methyltransferase [Solirubrobacteraceae bacterium]|nr:class I SAM-dependent methyltransferase [Solirubrobacteraceae bacterium]
MPETAELADFYEEGYSQDPTSAARASRWRALGAMGKADHVIALCAAAGLAPQRTLEVGCGDGALLCELHRRGFGGRLAGVEIAPAAVAIARARGEIERVEIYDGRLLPARDGEFELGILSHVLEHVHDPAALLAETARACRAVVVEVPLEDNLSARRAAKRAHAAEVGHLHRLSRAAARRIVHDAGLRTVGATGPEMRGADGPRMTGAAGLRIAGELEDALPLEVHRFLASSASAATVKWALRAGPHRLAPGLARRLFTVHYACLCLPRQP